MLFGTHDKVVNITICDGKNDKIHKVGTIRTVPPHQLELQVSVRMNIRVSSLRGKKVYTSVAKYLGRVNGVKFDVDQNRVASLSVKIDRRAKGLRSRVVLIPYSWVTAIGDIVIIDRTLSESWREKKESDIRKSKDFVEI